jgi:hypothetical protein
MMRRLMLARLMLAELFGGGDQSILNVHLAVDQAVGLLEDWARELQEDGLGYYRQRANYGEYWPSGTPGVGGVWRAKAQTKRAITGTPGVCFVYVDELQDASTEIVQRAIRPTMSGARVVMPQAWFTGTGEKDESELLRHMRAAFEGGSEDILWLEWSAPPGTDPADPGGWVWASPDWSDARREFLEAESRTIPARVFRSEYLVSHDAMVTRWLSERVTDAAAGRVGDVMPADAVCALEQNPHGTMWSLVGVWPEGAGLVARVWRLGSPLEAVDVVGDRTVWMHPATADILPPQSVRWEAMDYGKQLAATDALRERMLEHGLRVQGMPVEQWGHVVVSTGRGRPLIDSRRSRGDVEAVQALSWAVWAAGRYREPVLV